LLPQGDIYDEVGGLAVPNRNSIRAMLHQVGYPDAEEAYRFFPNVSFAYDEFREDECLVNVLEATKPPVGAAPSGAPPYYGGPGQPEAPLEAGVVGQGTKELIAYGLAGAFVVATAVMLWRGKAW
jgi:hypothetical protein